MWSEVNGTKVAEATRDIFIVSPNSQAYLDRVDIQPSSSLVGKLDFFLDIEFDIAVRVAGTDRITFTPYLRPLTSTMKVNGQSVESGEGVPFVLPPNVPLIVEIEVTAEDEIHQLTYKFTITRETSANAFLSGLVLSDGTLTFDKNTFSYAVSVPHAVDSLTVTPTAEHQTSRVKVNGVDVASGQASPNAGFGGAFWYISHDIPELYEPFRNAARRQNVPLFNGEPEAPFIQMLAPNVYKFFGVQEHYDYLEKIGQMPSLNYGTSCGTYARTKAECLTLLTELPYFTHPSIQDQSETDMTSREVLLKGADLADAHYAQVDEYLSGFRRYISEDNPFVRLVDEMIGMAKESGPGMRQYVSSNPELDRPAPASLVFDSLTVRKFYMGLLHGMAVRTCRFELERRTDSGEAYTVLKNALDTGEARLNALCEELERELDYEVVPIRNLVSIQLESGLLVADYMAKNWKR